jgi:hypothetical protein
MNSQEHDNVMKGQVMADIAIWSIPSGFAADKTHNIIERIKHYRFVQVHTLNDNTNVIPTLLTAIHVVKAYDEFGSDFPVAVDVESYKIVKGVV